MCEIWPLIGHDVSQSAEVSSADPLRVPAHGLSRACVYTDSYIMFALHMRGKTSYDFAKLLTIVKYI